jgi:small subunit ribosomal protein S16
MATSIRLKRVGAKKEASFRIVVMDSRTGTSGSSVERLGIYNPRTTPSLIRLNAARTLYWLHEGAMPSDTVRSLLRQTGVWEQFSRGVTPEEIEEPVIELGPGPGERSTSQRPAPVEKAMRGGAPEAAAAAAAAAEVPAPEVEAEAAEEEPAAEAEEPVAEAAAEEEPAAEASEEESEPVEEPTAEAEEPVAEAAAEEEPAAEEAAEEATEDEQEEEEKE